MKLGVVQLRSRESILYNKQSILTYIKKSKEENVELLAFPETALTGYIYDDFLTVDFSEVEAALGDIQKSLLDCNLCTLIGTPTKVAGEVYNSAAVLFPSGERIIYHKMVLTDYEQKYFKEGKEEVIFTHNGCKFGVMICRDQNNPSIAKNLKDRGAKAIFICSAHYYELIESKMKMAKNIALPIARAYENNIYILKSNAVGTIKGKISFGNSMIVHPNGIVIYKGSEKNEELLTYDLLSDRENKQW